MNTHVRAGVALLALMLAGCASYPDVPDAIRTAPPSDVSPSQVRDSEESFEGRRVRWGGTVLDVKNQAEESWVEVLAYPLESVGRPDTDARAQGRFFGRVGGFLDPAVYGRGRRITLVGALGESVVQKIGDHEYRYPVVRADAHHLWPRAADRSPSPYWDYPYYRDDLFFFYGRPVMVRPWYW